MKKEPELDTAKEFAGRVAMVTGGANGIGASTCTVLAHRGAAVAIVDRDLEGAQRVVQALQDQGATAMAIQADVTNTTSIQLAVGQIVQNFGALHLAVNNAGVATPYSLLGETELQVWDRVIGIDLTGVFLCMRHQIPEILKSNGGAIVNLASILGVNGMRGRGVYAAAKHGVIGLTKSAALDYAESGLRVNAVAPGYVDTPLLHDRDDDARRKIADLHPMKRLAQPVEIAETITFLLSERASFVTGQTYLVDGGFTSQ